MRMMGSFLDSGSVCNKIKSDLEFFRSLSSRAHSNKFKVTRYPFLSCIYIRSLR